MKILRSTVTAIISWGFATNLFFNSNIQTAVAQQIPRVEQQNFPCQEAIRSSEVLLMGNEAPNLSDLEMNLPARLMDISQIYRSYPNNRFLGVVLAVSTPAGHNIMSSPRIMQKISQNIISNCNSIGTVLFQSRVSDWIEIYGMINDQATRFRCIGEGPAADGQRPVWGERFCV